MGLPYKDEEIKISTGAKRYVRGAIPDKVSQLENDLNFVSLENLEEILNGGESENPLLVNLVNSLTDEQKEEFKAKIGIVEFRAIPIASEDIKW